MILIKLFNNCFLGASINYNYEYFIHEEGPIVFCQRCANHCVAMNKRPQSCSNFCICSATDRSSNLAKSPQTDFHVKHRYTNDDQRVLHPQTHF